MERAAPLGVLLTAFYASGQAHGGTIQCRAVVSCFLAMPGGGMCMAASWRMAASSGCSSFRVWLFGMEARGPTRNERPTCPKPFHLCASYLRQYAFWVANDASLAYM